MIDRDPRLPFTQLDPGFLVPRDPILGYVKVGGKSSHVRHSRAGVPWVAPERFVEPARFEVTTREKVIREVKGTGAKSSDTFKVDLGYKRDEAFHKKVGAQPNELKIRLLYPRWNQNLVSFLGAYSGKAWECRGDGVEAHDVKRGDCVCPCPRLKQFTGTYEGTQPKDSLPCKPHGTFLFMLEEADVFGGFWAFKTTSFESISNVMKSLQTLERMFVRVDGLPLRLRVQGVTKSYGDGSTVQPIVTVVLAEAFDNARQLAAQAAEESRRFMPADRELDHSRLLAAVTAEMEEEAQSYAGEFIPESVDPDRPAVIVGGPVASSPQIDEEEEAAAEEELEQQAEPEIPDPDRNDPAPSPADVLEGVYRGDYSDKPEGDSPDAEEDESPSALELTCREVLARMKWTDDMIEARVEFMKRAGRLDELADRLERSQPEAWTAVTAQDVAEPDDGLGA